MRTIEEQIRAIADEAFDQTTPIRMGTRNQGAALTSDPVEVDDAGNAATGKRVRFAAAGLLLMALVGGLIVLADRGSDRSADEADGLSIIESLARVPGDVATFGDLRIAGADLVAVERLAEIERPTTLAAGRDEWLSLVIDGSVSGDSDTRVVIPRSLLLREGLRNPDAFTEELPFSPLDVGRYVTVEAGGVGRRATLDVFTLLSGVEAVEEAVDGGGYLKVGTGEMGERNLAERTPLRQTGEPLQVGFDATNSTIAVDRYVDLVSAWLDRTAPSVLDVSPDVRAVAEQLDRVDGLTAFGIDVDDYSIGALDADEMVGFDEMDVIDRPFSTLGFARAGIGETARSVFVYAFSDEQSATDAVRSFEDVFAPDNVVATFAGEDPLTMRSVFNAESIEVIGRTVVVTSSLGDVSERLRPGTSYVPPFVLHR